MTPDIEELITKVNTLTLDKNRLKQRLTQLTQNGSQFSPKEKGVISNQSVSQCNTQLQHQGSSSDISGEGNNVSKNVSSLNSNINSSKTSQANSISVPKGSNVIAGVECSTSSEDDLLYMNELYRKRLADYDENWNYIQGKCTALLSELNALQKHYAMLKKEKLEIENKLKTSCDDNDNMRSEHQTVVLNYELQLSAMSDHLSMITSQVNSEDKLTRVQPH